MDIGSIFLILALVLLVSWFVSRPLMDRKNEDALLVNRMTAEQREHRRSALLAERDRLLTALQDLDFDNGLGKIPEEDFPQQRQFLLQAGADILRELDTLEPQERKSGSAEERVEAAVAARRADSASPRKPLANAEDDLEDLIAARRRSRQEKSAGFCPQCGKPLQKSDQFCSRCGASIQ